MPSPILESQPLAMTLIVYDEGEPLELAPVRVRVEGENAERTGERDPGVGLARRIIDLDSLKLAPVTGNFRDQRKVANGRAADQ